MTTPPDDAQGGTRDQNRSRAEIEAEIEATRQQLGQTVDELSHRLDVKSRLKEEARHRREQVSRQVQQRPGIPLAVAAGVVLLGTVLVWRRRRRR